ncbi:MAG: L7Ae/L30e/S12e/Gadd45 family ribosomal protein [Oscillospiraceae bacterium]
MDKLLNLIGLAQKAGRLAVGEEPTGAAARARDARLILVAADAAENSVRRVRHFADAGQCLWCRIGADKDALGRAVGRSSCAMLAVTDIGFAEAIAKKLAEGDERFAETAEKLAVKAQRAAERRREAEAHERTSAPARSVRRKKRRRQAKRSRSGRKSVSRCGLPRERAESARPARRAAATRRSRAARSVSAAPSRRRQERATRIPVRSSAARAARKKRSSNSVPSHLEVLYWLLRRTRTR